MRRTAILLFICLCAVLYGTQSQAKMHQGKWENISWDLNTRTGVLIITGKGEIPEVSSSEGEADDDAPGYHEYYKKVKKVIFRGPITKIGGYFFENYENITSVELPDSLKEIGVWAFRQTTHLRTIRLPEGLTIINSEAFANSGIEEITIPSGVKKISESAFSSCYKLRKVTISEGVEELGNDCFSSCYQLSEVKLPNSLKKIGSWCFGNTRIKKIVIPKNVERIEMGAFSAWDDRWQPALREMVIKSKKIKRWEKGVFGDHPREDLIIKVPKNKKNAYSKTLYAKKLPEYVKVIGKKNLEG